MRMRSCTSPATGAGSGSAGMAIGGLAGAGSTSLPIMVLFFGGGGACQRCPHPGQEDFTPRPFFPTRLHLWQAKRIMASPLLRARLYYSKGEVEVENTFCGENVYGRYDLFAFSVRMIPRER